MSGGDNCWPVERTKRALHLMLQQGMCWEDRPGDGQATQYYFPSVWKTTREQGDTGGSGGGESKAETAAAVETLESVMDRCVHEGLDYLEIRNTLESQFGATLSVAQRRDIKSKLQSKK
jgi:hypothetical protein